MLLLEGHPVKGSGRDQERTRETKRVGAVVEMQNRISSNSYIKATPVAQGDQNTLTTSVGN